MAIQLLDDLAQMRRLLLREHSRSAGIVVTQEFGHGAGYIVELLHLCMGFSILFK